MTSFKPNPTITTIVPVILFVGMFVYLTIVMGRNDRMADDLKEERLTSELLLSEKLLQEKKKVEWEQKFASLNRKFNSTNSKLQTVIVDLSQKEADLQKEKSGYRSLLIKKQKEQLEVLKNTAKEDSVRNALELAKLIAENGNLQKALSERLEEKEKYNFEIERLKRLRMDEVGIESLKKYKRLTAKASKTKTISVTLQVSSQARDLTFSIVSPDGTQLRLDEKNSSLTISEPQDQKPSQAFYVSPELQVSTIEKTKTVEINYTSSTKLQPGIYKVSVKSAGESVGNLMLRLE
jgi:hypothetical protein